MPSPDLVLAGSYDHGLVALSVVIAVLASYTALDLAGRVTATHGRARLIWLVGGATAMGIGIWSMHYVGMLAFSLPVPVQYDWPMVLASLATGILSAALALFVVSRQRMGALRASGASIFMGGGITAMHYTGMVAMRLPAMCHYSPPLVALSVVLAIAFSLIALWLTFHLRGEAGGRRLRKGASALLMGAAISDMHYTAMGAASFTRAVEVPDLSHAISISSVGAAAIAMATLMVLGIALVTSVVDRLWKQRALLDGLFEQAPEAVALMSVDNRVVRVNREFTRIFGYTPHEVLGRRLSDLVLPDELRDEFERFTDLVAHGQRVDAESIRRRKDGSRLPVSIVRVGVSVPGRQVAEYGIYHDITERKRAEEYRQRSLEQLRALAARLQSVREEERTRVAREIHDELGQALTAIKLDLTALLRDLQPDQGPAVRRGQSILKLLDETILSVRRIATDLRPGVLDDLGLVAAVEWAAEEFQARTGIKCRLSMPDVDIAMDPERATALFRIFQETLTNVARHANATQVNVRLVKQNGDLSLEVCDDGKGITEKQLSVGQSLGILGMRERALLLGGELTISGGPGKGTTVRVRIPNIHCN
jgi:PAS domain S-box-containing protein